MYKLVITEELKKEIDYLHREFGHMEWSGILAYKIERGTLNEENALFLGLGMYVMDVGTQTSTSFSHRNIPMINMYFTRKLKTSEFLLGAIHTHHNMGAFISSVDQNEIETNVNVFNNYLFLVVDTKESYVAKLGRKKDMVIKECRFVDEWGKLYSVENSTVVSKSELFDVSVEIPKVAIPSSEFIEVVNNLKLEKESRRLSGFQKTELPTRATTASKEGLRETNLYDIDDSYYNLYATNNHRTTDWWENEYESLSTLYKNKLISEEYLLLMHIFDIDDDGLEYFYHIGSFSKAEIHRSIEEFITEIILVETSLKDYLRSDILKEAVAKTKEIVGNGVNMNDVMVKAHIVLSRLVESNAKRGNLDSVLKNKFKKEMEVLNGNNSKI